MRSLLVSVLFSFAAAAPAAAQVFLGAEVGPDAFTRADDAKIDTDGEDAFAWALSVEVSSSSLYTVFESTAPEREILKYLRQGIYRQELAAMLLMSEHTSVPFKTLAADLAKAGSFRALAKKHKADAMALFGAGGRLKEAADLRLPLFLISTSTSGAAAYEAGLSTAAPAINAEKN
ncbi:MAG TPA: hypothetical protein DCS63_05335 [Elusimicrobia bacterium]|nr:hypothetical protein [Elusimicrobiota bacterium]